MISSTHVEDKSQLLSQIVNSFIQRQVSMKFLFHTVLVLITISVKRNVAKEKRLLLNDPEALLTQIHALQQEVQQQKSENQVLRNDVDDLKRRFRAMESESGNQGIPVHSLIIITTTKGKILL